MKIIAKSIPFLFLLTISGLYAREIPISSQQRFNEIIPQHGLVIAMFYKKHSYYRKKTVQIREIKRIFRGLSREQKYRDAGIAFFSVNVRQGDFSQLLSDWGIKRLPAFVLIENGEPVTENGKTVQVRGFVKEGRLESFISDYWEL